MVNNNDNQNKTRQLTQEELQKTQVLNLKEVEEAVRFEKRTSKKPALLFAILGIISLFFGTTIQITSSVLKDKEVSNETYQRQVPEKEKIDVMTCSKTNLNKPDGTDVIYSINYNFLNSQLEGFTKTYTVTQTAGNDIGKTTIKAAEESLKKYINNTEGYEVELSTSENGYVLIVKVDFEELELSTLNPKQKDNSVTNIDYTYKTDKQTIKEESLKKGFTCN